MRDWRFSLWVTSKAKRFHIGKCVLVFTQNRSANKDIPLHQYKTRVYDFWPQLLLLNSPTTSLSKVSAGSKGIPPIESKVCCCRPNFNQGPKLSFHVCVFVNTYFTTKVNNSYKSNCEHSCLLITRWASTIPPQKKLIILDFQAELEANRILSP